LTEPQSI